MTAMLPRRRFVAAGAASCGGLLVGVSLPPRACARGEATAPAATYTLTAWVSVATTGTVSILCGSQDMGQGIFSALAQIVAEELRVPWQDVQPGPAPVGAAYDNPLLGGQFTAASSSVRGYFAALLEAGAIARQMLITAGAAALKVPAKNCVGQNGMVVDSATGASIAYGAVAKAASHLTPPQTAPLYSASGYTLVGTPVPRPDIPGKVAGSTVFGTDVVVPGMQYGAVLLSPARGGTVASIGAAPPGVQLVNLGVGVAAVANPGPNNTTWWAMQALSQLAVKWAPPANASAMTSAAILKQAQGLVTAGTGIVAQSTGDVASAQAGAAKTLSLTYTLPYLAHTTMEVPVCTASVTATSCEIWAPTQAPAAAQAAAASITGLAASAVTVNVTAIGGGLGRKLETDFISYAVMASKALGVPVQLMFPRPQDFTQDQYRPFGVCNVTVGLTKGAVVSWRYRNVSPSILAQRGLLGAGALDTQASEGSTGLPYDFPALLVDWVQSPAAVPVGFWRSVGNSINCFAVESALDEAAHASNIDPLAFRQTLLAGNARALNVLNTAAALAGWGTTIPNAASGLAYGEFFGSLVALVVTVAESAGTIRLLNVACAVDCGMVVNPDTARQQVEGGIIQGLSSGLWGQMLFKNGVAQTSNFDFLRMMRMSDMPVIEVQIIQTAGAAMGGLGEVGVPCVAPALASAWFRLTGKRVRTLPLFQAI